MIKTILVEDDKLCYLGKQTSSRIIYENENYKLNKVELKTIRNYYSCYKEFSKEEMDTIVKLCNDNGFTPHFLTIEELIELIIIKTIKLHSKDALMEESLIELDKRLKYIKY